MIDAHAFIVLVAATAIIPPAELLLIGMKSTEGIGQTQMHECAEFFVLIRMIAGGAIKPVRVIDINCFRCNVVIGAEHKWFVVGEQGARMICKCIEKLHFVGEFVGTRFTAIGYINTGNTQDIRLGYISPFRQGNYGFDITRLVGMVIAGQGGGDILQLVFGGDGDTVIGLLTGNGEVIA